MLVQIVRADAGKLRLRFINNTDRPEWLAKSRALLGSAPDGGFLEIEPEGNYRGPVVKRLPYTIDELFELESGEAVLSDEFSLADWYHTSEKSVRVKYHASHPLRGIDQVTGPLTLVESDAIEVESRF